MKESVSGKYLAFTKHLKESLGTSLLQIYFLYKSNELLNLSDKQYHRNRQLESLSVNSEKKKTVCVTLSKLKGSLVKNLETLSV